MSQLVRVGTYLYGSWRCSEQRPEERLVRSDDHGRSWQVVTDGGLDDWGPRGIVRTDDDHAVALLARGKARTVAWLGGR
jgi:hypothetical protein